MKAKTLVRIRICFYSAWALSGAWNTTMAGVKWDSMGWEEQSCLIVGILQIWTGTMMAFFDKSVWRAEEEAKNGIDKGGKPPEVPKP